jgi:hypothetical protein
MGYGHVVVVDDVLVRLEWLESDERRETEVTSLCRREELLCCPLSDVGVGEPDKGVVAVKLGRIVVSFKGPMEELNWPKARVL